MINSLSKIGLLICLFSVSIGMGQITSSIDKDHKLKLSQDNNKLYFLVKESFPLHAEGQTFFNEKWTKGVITSTQNERFDISLRYRVANEEMQVKHNGKTKALQLPQIKTVEFGEHVFIASDFMLNEEKFMSFFEVLGRGKLQLLKQYDASQKKGLYTIHNSFYSKSGNNPAKKIEFKKKCILKLMSNKKTVIQKYLKKEKINLKNSDDLKKLFNYYNSL